MPACGCADVAIATSRWRQFGKQESSDSSPACLIPTCGTSRESGVISTDWALDRVLQDDCSRCDRSSGVIALGQSSAPLRRGPLDRLRPEAAAPITGQGAGFHELLLCTGVPCKRAHRKVRVAHSVVTRAAFAGIFSTLSAEPQREKTISFQTLASELNRLVIRIASALGHGYCLPTARWSSQEHQAWT